MKTSHRNIVLLMGVCCLLSSLPLSGAYSAKEKELMKKNDVTKQYVDVYNARKSGKWDSDIWAVTNPLDDKHNYDPKKGARPHPNADCRTLFDNITVTLSNTAAVGRLWVGKNGSRIVLARGAVLTANPGYYGFLGTTSGGMEMREGSVLNIDRYFFLTGTRPDVTGTGTFLQSGGTVSSTGTLFLSGNNVLSCSSTAQGVYTLAGGSLNLNVHSAQSGISIGTGGGKFFFGKGTLNANRVAIDLDNVNGGNLSPGGDEQVGETRLMPDAIGQQSAQTAGRPFDEQRTYKQGAGSTWTVNIASRKDYDKVIWTGSGDKNRMVFENGAVIKIVPLKNFKPTTKANFDIATADEIVLNGDLRLEGAAKGFSYECVDGKILRLKYEP